MSGLVIIPLIICVISLFAAGYYYDKWLSVIKDVESTVLGLYKEDDKSRNKVLDDVLIALDRRL